MKFGSVPTHTFKTPHAEAVYWAACRARTLLDEANVDVGGLQAKIEMVFASSKRDLGNRCSKTLAKRPVNRKSNRNARAEPNGLDLAFQLAHEQYGPFCELLKAEGWANVFLAVLAREVVAHPDVNPSSVIRAQSHLLDWSMSAAHNNDYKRLHEGQRAFEKELVRGIRKARGGLKKGAPAGGAVVRERAQSTRQQCISIDRGNPDTKLSLKARTNYVHNKLTDSAGIGDKVPAWHTVKDYLKNSKRAGAKPTKA
jgi:hypothetical protein